MIRLLATFSLICFIALTMAQGKLNIVGTWIPAKGQPDVLRNLGNLQVTFRKDGSCHVIGHNVVGDGTYKVAADKIVIILSRRNGSAPTTAQEKQGTGTIVENGKAILLPTGEVRGGKRVFVRLVRK